MLPGINAPKLAEQYVSLNFNTRASYHAYDMYKQVIIMSGVRYRK